MRPAENLARNQEALERICLPLKAALKELLGCGADVTAIDHNRWTECALRVCLDSGPSLDELRRNFSWRDGVASFTHSDSRYPAVVGLYCKQFKHGIDWPLDKVWQKSAAGR